MVSRMYFDPMYEEILTRHRPMDYPIFKVILKHSRYHSYVHEPRKEIHRAPTKRLSAFDANITQFTSAQIKENIYSIMQEENNLTCPSKKRYYEEPLVQALDISMMKGLSKVGYQALFQENDKTLPTDINATLSMTCETDEEKVSYLAQLMLDAPILDNIVYACDKHYAQSNVNRVPLYKRKSWHFSQNQTEN